MPFLFLIAAAAMGVGAELDLVLDSGDLDAGPLDAGPLDVGQPPAIAFLDPGGWLADGGVVTMPDAIGAEAALTRFDVDTRQATVVSAAVHRSLGKQPRVRIRRVRLGTGGVASSAELRGLSRCTDVGDVDWTSGPGLRVEATGLGTSDPSSASVVLVEGNPRIGALVMLVPGDTTEIREVRRSGHLLRESLTVRHGEDVMALRREGDRREVCHAMSVSEPQLIGIAEGARAGTAD